MSTTPEEILAILIGTNLTLRDVLIHSLELGLMYPQTIMSDEEALLMVASEILAKVHTSIMVETLGPIRDYTPPEGLWRLADEGRILTVEELDSYLEDWAYEETIHMNVMLNVHLITERLIAIHGEEIRTKRRFVFRKESERVVGLYVKPSEIDASVEVIDLYVTLPTDRMPMSGYFTHIGIVEKRSI